MAAATAIPEPIPDRTDIQKGLRTVFLNRVAHMGMMLDKVNRQNRRVERIEKFAATGDVKDLDMPAGDEDDMGVAIGNENHYHFTVAEPPASAVTPPAPAPTPAPSQTVKIDSNNKIAIEAYIKRKIAQAVQAPVAAPATDWARSLLFGAIAAGVLGAGLGTPLAVFLSRPTTPAVDLDTDTRTETTFPE